MGGRGSSSGISNKQKEYGTEYTTLYQSGNIKFVRYNDGAATAPMETMTQGRIYATVDYKNDVKHISYYDKNNKRFKQIDLTHYHSINGKHIKPHTHKGYFHDEKGSFEVSEKERKMIERVSKVWYNRGGK